MAGRRPVESGSTIGRDVFKGGRSAGKMDMYRWQVDRTIRVGGLEALMAIAEVELLNATQPAAQEDPKGISASVLALIWMMASLGWGAAVLLCLALACGPRSWVYSLREE